MLETGEQRAQYSATCVDRGEQEEEDSRKSLNLLALAEASIADEVKLVERCLFVWRVRLWSSLIRLGGARQVGRHTWDDPRTAGYP